MKYKRDIFTFNHIDTSIDEVRLLEIKALYRFYHKKWWCYQKTFKRFKRTNLLINLGSSALIATGTIVGGITLNPIILGSIAGLGLLLKTYSEFKNYTRKVEMSKFAYTTYQKVLVELRACLRGKGFDHDSFINEMKLIDDIVIDLCPPLSSFAEKKYVTKFIAKRSD